MMLDIRALGTFNRLAQEGAEHAATSLGQMTGNEPLVEATAINLIATEDVGREFRDNEFVGVRIGFDGGLTGESVLAIERDGARRLIDGLPGDDSPELTEDRIEEVGNILIGGFLDGWADYLGAAIDFTPPTYVEGTGRDVFPDGVFAWEADRQVFAFTSELKAWTEAVELLIYLLPEFDVFEELVAGPRGGNAVPVPFDQLVVFNHMTREGAATASDDLTAMTGIETTVEVSHLSFVPVEGISSRIDDERYVGVVIQCHGLPGGYVLVLFSELSARVVAEKLVPAPVEDGELTDLHRSAIMEIGNVVTSGFVDGWANVLGTTIDVSPPKFVHDGGRAILNSIAARLGRRQEFAFVVDSTLVTSGEEIGCNVFALPNESELARALNALSVDPADVDARGRSPVPGSNARYEEL